MEFFGNSSDPFAKTLEEINKHAKATDYGNSGDFFSGVCERDPYSKPKNSKEEIVEFNAAILELDNSNVMLEYINLKNNIIKGDCMAIEETQSVDKESGAITVFIKWLQPEGLFTIGTANEKKIVGTTVDTPTSIPAPSAKVTSPPKKFKGKGSRKKNKQVGGGYGSL